MAGNEVAEANITIQPVYPTTLSFIGTFIGREEIKTVYRKITPENLYTVLQKAIPVYENNKRDIQYLYEYYLGLQPILQRKKLIRPDINNKIVVNHAAEAADFFTGYIFGDPIVYSGRAEADCSEEIQLLNGWNQENDIDTVNVELGAWLNICGQGYKVALPRREVADAEDVTSPYVVSVLDPREAFVVYYNGIEKVPVMGVKVVDLSGDPNVPYTKLYCIYTEDSYYEVPNTEIGAVELPVPMRNPIGMIPIIEYRSNLARRGRIEPVIPITDAMNILASNRLDGVEQLIQSILLLRNIDLSGDDVKKLSQFGAIKYKDVDPSTPGEVRYITAELNQEGAQTLKDDLYESFLIISGMPNRNTGNGDNGVAVIYRDGWSAAETKAKEMEKYFSSSERNFIRVILRIVREIRTFDIHLPNIDITFTRKNYENLQTKSQVLTTMLGSEKIAPRLAFVYSGMFADPEAAWKESMEYYEKNKETEVRADGEDPTVARNDTEDRSDAEQGSGG